MVENNINIYQMKANYMAEIIYKNFLIDQRQRQYSGHNIPLSHRTDHSQ